MSSSPAESTATATAKDPSARSLPARVLGSRGERLAESQPARGARVVAYAVLLLLGAAVSLTGCFVQALWPPAGLVLALAATCAVFYGGLRVTGTKLGAGAPLVGWFLVLMVLMAPRPEGDFVLAASYTSYTYLFLGAVSGVVCATLPTRGGFGLLNP